MSEKALTIVGIFDLAANKGLTPRAWTWKPLQNYNGFNHAQRVRKWQAIHLGNQLGLIPPAADFPCDICGATATSTQISYHSEDYSRMAGHYPLCIGCHTRIHRRFSHQKEWLDLVQRYRKGNKWFECLKRFFGMNTNNNLEG